MSKTIELTHKARINKSNKNSPAQVIDKFIAPAKMIDRMKKAIRLKWGDDSITEQALPTFAVVYDEKTQDWYAEVSQLIEVKDIVNVEGAE